MKSEKNVIEQFPKVGVEKLGEKMFNLMSKKEQKALKEAYATLKEDTPTGLDTTTAPLFSSIVATFIEAKMRPELVANKVIKEISMDIKGFNQIKIPIREDLITATNLPTSGELTYQDDGYETADITTSFKYAANRITWEVINYASVDLIANEIYEIGYALSRKIDSDIIAAIDAACTAQNGNLKNLGTSTYVTYDSLIEGFYGAIANFAKPNWILTGPDTAIRIMKLTEFKTAWYGGVANPLQSPSEVFRPLQVILGCGFLVSNQVGANNLYFIDSERTGYLVKSNLGVQTFDGRVSGALAFEIAGAVCYGVGIVQPKSIYKLKGNVA